MRAEASEREAGSTTQSDYLSEITSILMHALKEKSCVVYLFGSRASGTYTIVSDFDIAVLSTEDVSRELSLAREMLDRSNIPFTVDLVDLRSAEATFRRRAQTEGALLWKN